jgi:hypothetical protein
MNTADLPIASKTGQNRLTQNQKVLATLEEFSPDWVPMPKLVEISGSYVVHSRISDLRQKGHPIEHRREIKAGQYHSFYRIAAPARDASN